MRVSAVDESVELSAEPGLPRGEREGGGLAGEAGLEAEAELAVLGQGRPDGNVDGHEAQRPSQPHHIVAGWTWRWLLTRRRLPEELEAVGGGADGDVGVASDGNPHGAPLGMLRVQ